MRFFDTETCGLHGPIVLFQYADDFGEIILYEPWKEPINKTLKLFEETASKDVVGFNLAFDWFHVQQMYNVLELLATKIDPNSILENHINEYAMCEPDARLGRCIKPANAFDLMLHARKGPYQSTMNRGDILIKRIPAALAWQVAQYLESAVPLKDIYFSRRKTFREPKWKVEDIADDDGLVNPDFKNIVLKFKASSALKVLATDALGLEETLLFSDIELDAKLFPDELGWAPFALALSSPKLNWMIEKSPWIKGTGWTWPAVIRYHIDHWRFKEVAREYARKDVLYTRQLFWYFSALNQNLPAREIALSGKGCVPLELGDDDSILACMVGSVRWHGFAIDRQKLIDLRIKKKSQTHAVPTSPQKSKEYISEPMSLVEKLTFKSTGKVFLENVEKWVLDCPEHTENCLKCDGSGFIQHESAIRAKQVLESRQADKMILDIDKLLLAGRFHASFVVIGTLSTRMAGGDGFNPQGMSHLLEFRECFKLADSGFSFDGGDFDSFEVSIAAAVYNDEKLTEVLLSGKKLHAILGSLLFKKTYEEVTKSKGTNNDMYDKGKKGVFLTIYGGVPQTFVNKLGVEIEAAEEAFAHLQKEYPGIAIERQKIYDMFGSMRQPGGVGSKVIWHQPADFVESGLGFKRYFTLENKICKALYDVAQNPPKDWKAVKIKVQRRDREQTASGACQSALFAAAFAIQASNMRAASNHRIQSYGAGITKKVERRIWDIQPSGVSDWIVLPMNVHDELLAPTKKGYQKVVKERVDEVVESFKIKIPLLKMDWKIGLNSWAEK